MSSEKLKRDEALKTLSAALQPILELELSLGNAIHSVDVNAWTESPLVVTLIRPLHVEDVRAKLSLPSDTVSLWENHDTHYPLERGYACRQTKHSLSGPLSK